MAVGGELQLLPATSVRTTTTECLPSGSVGSGTLLCFVECVSPARATMADPVQQAITRVHAAIDDPVFQHSPVRPELYTLLDWTQYSWITINVMLGLYVLACLSDVCVKRLLRYLNEQADKEAAADTRAALDNLNDKTDTDEDGARAADDTGVELSVMSGLKTVTVPAPQQQQQQQKALKQVRVIDIIAEQKAQQEAATAASTIATPTTEEAVAAKVGQTAPLPLVMAARVYREQDTLGSTNEDASTAGDASIVGDAIGTAGASVVLFNDIDGYEDEPQRSSASSAAPAPAAVDASTAATSVTDEQPGQTMTASGSSGSTILLSSDAGPSSRRLKPRSLRRSMSDTTSVASAPSVASSFPELDLPASKRRLLNVYVVQVFGMTVCLILEAMYSVDLLLFREPYGASMFYDMRGMRVVLLMIQTVYVWELIYRDEIGFPLLLHHIISCFLAQFLPLATEQTLHFCFFKILVIFSFAATTEQATFVGLFFYRLQCYRLSTFWCIFGALQSGLTKVLLVVWSIYVWATEMVPIRTSSPWAHAWTYIHVPLQVVLFGAQVYGTVVVYALGIRSYLRTGAISVWATTCSWPTPPLRRRSAVVWWGFTQLYLRLVRAVVIKHHGAHYIVARYTPQPGAKSTTMPEALKKGAWYQKHAHTRLRASSVLV